MKNIGIGIGYRQKFQNICISVSQIFQRYSLLVIGNPQISVIGYRRFSHIGPSLMEILPLISITPIKFLEEERGMKKEGKKQGRKKRGLLDV